MQWVELSRSLHDVSLDSVQNLTAGVELSSLLTWGDTDDHRRSVYELNKTCSSDIPDRGAFFGAGWGCSEVRTVHHPNNAAIIAANRALGFREDTTGS